MKKVIIIGSSGAGKTTFAKKLAEKTGLPLYHLDSIWHKADRSHITREEFDRILGDILSKDSWIIDGEYSRTREWRIKECDTVFFLDFSLEVCLGGIYDRVGKPRAEMPWIETEVDPEFEQYVKDYHKESLPTLREALEKYKETKHIITFKTREEADRYIESLK